MIFRNIEYITEAGIPVESEFPKYLEQDVVYKVFPGIKDVIDDDGLVDLSYLLSNFEIQGSKGCASLGYFKSKTNEYSIMLHPYLRKSYNRINNFNCLLFSNLLEVLECHDNTRLKIAIDPNCIMLSKDWRHIFERERIYGPKFNPDIPSNKEGVSVYSSDVKEQLINHTYATQFYWKNKKDSSFQLEIEEIVLPDKPNIDSLFGCKYIHSLYKKDTMSFDHLDGAIRMYDENSIIYRQDASIKNIDKSNQYIKLFRVDGTIPFDHWKRIIASFSPHNDSIKQYFND